MTPAHPTRVNIKTVVKSDPATLKKLRELVARLAAQQGNPTTMPSLTTPKQTFKAFRFFVTFGEPLAADAAVRLGDRGVGLTRVESLCDELLGSALLLVRAHELGAPSLRSHVIEAAGHLSVWLLPPEGVAGGARRIDARFSDFTWLPVRLDATLDEVAEERVMLGGVEYAEPEDLA